MPPPCGSGLCPRRGPHIHCLIRNVHRSFRRLRGQSPLPQCSATLRSKVSPTIPCGSGLCPRRGPPIQTPSRAEPAPTMACNTTIQGITHDPLWERALPAKRPAHSPPHPKCAPPIQTPSRAKPAPTMACNTAIQGITHDPLVGAGSAREEARTFTASSEMYAAHPDAFAGRARSHNVLRHPPNAARAAATRTCFNLPSAFPPNLHRK
ncbi:hypothetical protein AHFPHNDE_01813 [Pseudomonas sp. MM227]|nr:hypothetical protein AHFPHNDE_01813 [Pseudomonas sp. MM227]